MKIQTLFVVTLSVALGACASMNTKKQNYADYAGPPVNEISYTTSLYNWQRTGDKSVAVWTKPSAAYLLTLKENCEGLDGQVRIQLGGVDGIGGKLHAGTDDVVVGGLRCRITQIQPIDLQKMKDDRA